MKVEFLGATDSVTGSMSLIYSDSFSILVDAGLFQGQDTHRQKSLEERILHEKIDLILLTHAHLDHCGYIPRLYKLGFRGEIWCTKATCDIMRVILLDNARIESKRIKKINKKISKEKHKVDAFYEISDVEKVLQNVRTINLKETCNFNNFQISFHPSGHILGAASILVKCEDRSIFFSGDLGRREDVLHHSYDFQGLENEKIDLFVLESTYGDRLHASQNQFESLKKMIDQAPDKIIIPAFSFGRSQMLMLYLYEIYKNSSTKIYVDSPMTQEIINIYLRYTEELKVDKEKFEKIKQFFDYINFPKQRLQFIKKASKSIVLTSSGMLTGGPIESYLEKWAQDETCTIILTGFQAPGSLGADIEAGQREFLIDDKKIQLKAKLLKMNGLSSHPDQVQLMEIIKLISPRKITLVHGESSQKLGLKKKLESLQYSAEIVSFGSIQQV